MIKHDTLCSCSVHGCLVVVFSEVQLETLADEGHRSHREAVELSTLSFKPQHATHERKEGIAKPNIRSNTFVPILNDGSPDMMCSCMITLR